MKRKVLAAYVASALFGTIGTAVAHSDMDREASLPETSSPRVTSPATEDNRFSAGSTDVTELERYEPSPSDVSSSTAPVAADEPASAGSSTLSSESALPGIDPASASGEMSSDAAPAADSSASESYSLQPEPQQ